MILLKARAHAAKSSSQDQNSGIANSYFEVRFAAK
jgi:hypothetical protein